MLLVLLSVFSVFHLYSAQVPTPPAKNDASLYLDGTGKIPDYYQLTDADITATTGVGCVGGEDVTKISWILPNGVILENGILNTSSNLQLTMPATNAARLVAPGGPNTISSLGIFRCRAEFQDGTVIFRHVWIVDDGGTITPTIDTNSCNCSYVGINTLDQTHGIMVMVNIFNGAPTTVSCNFNGKSVSSMRTITINTFESPTSAKVNIISSIQVSSVPGSLVCTVSNGAGSSALTCNLQASKLGTPKVKSLIRDPNNHAVGTVNWDPVSDSSNSLKDYSVIVVSIDDKDFIQFKDINITGTTATITGLHPSLTYYVSIVANSVPSATPKTVIPPIVSKRSTLPSLQCQPDYIEKVHIKLNMFMENGSDFCSSLEDNDYYMDIIYATMNGSYQNCSVTDLEKTDCKAKIYTSKKTVTPKKTPKKDATPKKTKTPKKAKSPKKEKTGKSKNKNKVYININVDLMCNPCQTGDLTQKGTPKRTHHTHKSRGRGKKRSNVKNHLDFMLNGFAHKGYMKSRTYSQYCGSPLSPLPKGQKSCDCPTHCFAPLNKQYKCLGLL